MKNPLRVELLSEGIKLTCGSRDEEYGDPKVNMTCAGELKATIRRYMVRDITPAELEALDMVLTKMSRVITGPKVKGDTYVDGAVYFSIAGEMALRASEGQAATASEEEAPAVAQPSYELTAEERRWREFQKEMPAWAAE
jgi:hypothetical protein